MKNEEVKLVVKVKKDVVSCKIEAEDKEYAKKVKKILKAYRKEKGLSETSLFFKISLNQIKDGYHDVFDWSFNKNVEFKTYVGRLEDLDMILDEL